MLETRGQAEGSATRGAVELLFSRLRDWWQARGELMGIDRCELDRIAGELGLSGRDLEDLAARGPAAADQLYERMSLLGITTQDVERSTHGMMRDLQRTCARCGAKGVCESDLAAHSEDPAWKQYCPNAAILEAIKDETGKCCP